EPSPEGWPLGSLCCCTHLLDMARFFYGLCSVWLGQDSRKVEEDEYEDVTGNQKWVLAPRTQDTDATLILNKLLREYDKKLRPDIGIKPTVIDVDIYVNSIGPVSSINMHHSCCHEHTPLALSLVLSMTVASSPPSHSCQVSKY
uniref:Uncharacterized protein n=1 Tax=Chelonoidis abingdonii TaxID=106734 RepID=A0A8C0J3H3_CHEAB